ncbi:glycosyltransferase family 2 protein [Limnovirga soli]|uniref:Glycosyltransferase n=1 Tax=Limnovirga soli TaxID=2656915 RepID=A0A8J8FDX0_9BACT|nr:glycosyltransferase family 2 protein [Limnovirga soli]NNV54908.1 glycosyltransferase [Limnovirga soli]
MTSPLVSVLMCVYNGANLLPFTIESILEQTFTRFECIIVNDGSTDDSLSIIEKYAAIDDRIKLINKPNSGLINSLNVGLQACTCDIVIRHDAEDISHKNRFEILYNEMLQRPDVACVATLSFFINTSLQVIGFSPLQPGLDLNEALDKNQTKIWHPNVVYRKKDVLSVGGYPNVPHAEDHALWKLMRQKGLTFFMLRKPIYAYLKEPTGVSYNNMFTQVKAVVDAGNITTTDDTIAAIVTRNRIRNQYLYGFPKEIDNQPLFWVMYFKLLAVYQRLLIFKYRSYLKGFTALKQKQKA